MRTSWREKLQKQQTPKLVDIPPDSNTPMARRFGTGRMLIPRPLDVDALIRKVRKGRVVTQSLLRSKLAADHGADFSCPITTGIFVRIAAEAAEEDRRDGKGRITPYWRVVRDDGSLLEKLPGGPAAQARRLRQEGFVLEAGAGRKKPRVRDLEHRLARL